MALGFLAVSLTACGGGPSQPSSLAAPSQTLPTVTVLRVSKSGEGTGSVTSSPAGITCGDTCAATYFGAPEVTLTATPASESTFDGFGGDPDCADGRVALGVDVSCTARFEPIPPMLSVTGFMAFGDSMTFGTVAVPVATTFRLVGTPESFPTVLQAMLGARYTAQTIDMDNQGKPGERLADAGPRLSLALASRPPVVFLMEGANDLDVFGGMGPAVEAAGIDAMATRMDGLVSQARASGATVFLATLPPQRPSSTKARSETAPLVPIFNDRVRAIAASRQATLVDVFAGIDLSHIGIDGLHPTEQGYRRIAELFYAPIAAAFELPPQPTSGAPAPTVGDARRLVPVAFSRDGR
jgi:lysophospholipase L1-like esterase